MNASALPPPTWTTGTTEVFKTGTWRAALPRYREAPSPCRVACPAGGEIPVWMQHAKAGDFFRAWTTLTLHNPFPAVSGRVCHHPCEAACNRGGLDAALAVCAMERFVGDLALAQGWRYPEAPLDPTQRVAVVGAGPSGLSAAYQLRRRGYAVTLFEAQPELGGLLRHGIPPYRLPRAVLDGEIERILALGVELRAGFPLSTVERFARLRAQFDAVYLALGAGRPRRLSQLDYGVSWVMDSAAYLARSNLGAPPALGKRLVVIGGGSAAMDVARSARRAGHEVSVLSLESETQMPAQREEVVQAREEGIAFFEGAQLLRADAREGGVALQCTKVHFEAGPAAGDFKVTPIAGSDFEIRADAVVSAVGQDPELSALPLLRADRGLIWTDSRRATSVEGVYAGGDAASTARFVTQAIGMGKAAAREIDRWLQGEPPAHANGETAVALRDINTFYFPAAPRASSERRPVEERLAADLEVQLGIDAAQALAEAARCFSCGQCLHCDNCLFYCPDMAVRRVGGAYAIAGEYCKGCGLCVAECPTGSMAMVEENK